MSPPSEPDNAVERPRELKPRGRAIGVIVWSAFLAAAIATMVCFAVVDPASFEAGETPGWWSGRLRVYAIGFFFFWLIGLVAAGLSWQLAAGSKREP